MSLKKFYLICICILSLAGMNAQTKYAKILVYRNENTNDKVVEEYKIYADDNLTTSLKNNCTEEFYMPEGSFTLRVNDENPTSLTVECSKNNTYYFKIYRDIILQNKSIVIMSVDSMTAKNEMKYVKKPHTRQTIESNIEHSNALGVVFEPGRGFNKVGVLSTSAGTEAMLSFGGEGTIGLNYCREFNNHFGWLVELQDQFSSIFLDTSNSSVEFNTGIISTTPYFKIPILKHKQNIKIGAGLDYHFNPVLTYDTEKLMNGFKDEWVYNNVLGYHILFYFETKLGKKLRGHTGLKYSDVQYSFASSKKESGTVSYTMLPLICFTVSIRLSMC